MPLREKSLIERIRRKAGAARGRVVLGIGDDAAVLRIPAAHEVLVTTDFSLEDIHFRRAWHSPESVGHRCLTRGLSDIAAMGGQPIAAFLSLAVPAKLPQAWIDGFFRGLLALAGLHRVSLAGGDIAQSPGLPSTAKILADVMLVGSTPRGTAVRRCDAKPGDSIFVTGELGGSALALERMQSQPTRRLRPKNFLAHFFPQPRLAVGQFLRGRGIAAAMIDLSDGLSTDLHHLCEESGVCAELLADLVPQAPGATLEHALHGGEDYELLFTSRPNRKVPGSIAGVRITCIGEILHPRRGAGRVVIHDGKRRSRLAPRGWEHFATSLHLP